MTVITLKLKIRTPNRGKDTLLKGLSLKFTDCVKFHLKWILEHNSTNLGEIHRNCYKESRVKFGLDGVATQKAASKAIAIFNTHKANLKRNKLAKFPKLDKILPYCTGPDRFKIQGNVLRLSTPKNRDFLWLPLEIPDELRDKISLPHAISEIVKKGDEWYLMLAVKCEDVPAPVSDKQTPIFGLDLGLANLAVLSGPGCVRFFDGNRLRFIRNKYFCYRQELQKKRKIGMLKRSKGKESNWVENENHQISRKIIDTVAEVGGVLCVEKLLGIRERMKATKKINRMLHSWPFGQLLEFFRYKAKLAGVPVIEVDPRYTSQQCSDCGYTHKSNRKTQSRFLCKECYYEVHADLNAARNISAKGACFLGMGGKTPPSNGELSNQDNHNIESPKLGSLNG